MLLFTHSSARFGTLFVAGLLFSFASLAQPTGKAAQGRKKYLFPQKDAESSYVQNVTKNTEEDQDIDGSFTRLGYRPYADLLAEITELRRIHSWADTTYQRRLAALPEGGILLVTMRRQGSPNANPSYLTITATTKEGKEVFTHTPAAGTGRFFGRDLYQAKQQIPFPKMEAQTLNVSIRDAKLYQTFEYQMTVPAAAQ
ncbi:hypothetical protein GCM10023185_18970 [Hymenobacter saemangeumensis]|uniref:Uncharacterized protein n=1 Tax=Hymenobacter saemangeumensis TaxID=1084522 RepID=A0ABP8ICB1_9BACT